MCLFDTIYQAAVGVGSGSVMGKHPHLAARSRGRASQCALWQMAGSGAGAAKMEEAMKRARAAGRNVVSASFMLL